MWFLSPAWSCLSPPWLTFKIELALNKRDSHSHSAESVRHTEGSQERFSEQASVALSVYTTLQVTLQPLCQGGFPSKLVETVHDKGQCFR